MGVEGMRASILALSESHTGPWHRIYKYQAHGYAFSSVEELLHSLGGSGFLNMTQRPLSESLLELGVSQRFIDEVIAPIMMVNYGQNISIPAFVGKKSGGVTLQIYL